MLPPHIAALNQLGPSSPPTAHPFPSAHTPFIPPSRSGSTSHAAHPHGGASYGYPELHAPHSHHARGVDGGGEPSGSRAASPLTLDFQQSELDLNAALARQLEEWTNVDFSFDDGGVGVGMGLGLKSEGPAGWAGGAGGGEPNGLGQGQGREADDQGDVGNDPSNGHAFANVNGQAGPDDEEEERWDTKKGKGNRFASSRRLHERLEQSGAPGGEEQAPDQGQPAQAGSSNHSASQNGAGANVDANASANTAGPSTHTTPFLPSAPLGQHPPMLPGFPQLGGAGGAVPGMAPAANLALDSNLMAFLQSMYQSQLASQFGAQAQAWVAHQQGQLQGRGMGGSGPGRGQGPAGTMQGAQQQLQQKQGMNGHTQAQVGQQQQPAGSSSGPHTSGVNTPTSAHPANSSYYPAFAIDALTTLSDPGVWGGTFGGPINARAAPDRTGPLHAAEPGLSNARAGSSRAIDPSVVAPPLYDPSRSGRVSPRPSASRKQSGNSAADADGDMPTGINGASSRGKKRQRSSTLGRNEREDSTSDRSGTGEANGQGDGADGAGGIPAGTPAGNGMVYAANGEVVSHEEE